MAVTKPIASGTIVLGTPPEPGDNTAKVATMEAVQDLITERISSAFIYQGSTDCSTNPNYPAATAGHLYRVSVAGKIGGASGVPVGAGDFFVALEDNAGGTEAAVGASWEVWEGNLQPGVDYNNYRAEVDKLNVQAVALASAGTVDIGAASGDYISITGNTTITSFGTAEAGFQRVLVFTGTPVLTHNATSLILPTGANITCAVGDVAVMRSLGSGNWKCVSFVRATGEALVVTAASVASAIHGASEKTTPVNADKVGLVDSAASNGLKWLSWANLKAGLKTYFDTLYATATDYLAFVDDVTGALNSKAASNQKLDDFGGCDDNLDLNATTSAHGLCPKLGGGTTNFLRADGTWAAPSGGGGGSAISTPKVAYVETDGNNGTAVIGDPSKPYSTAQAANDAIAAAAAGDYGLHLGVGSFGGITGISSKIKSITGRGASLSFLGGITTTGSAVTLTSDMSCHLGNITTTGAEGSPGSVGGAEEYGGDGDTGGAGGDVSLRNCVFGTVTANGGAGGPGGVGGMGDGSSGNGGMGGRLEIIGCRFYYAYALGGVGAIGGGSAANCIIAQSVFYGAEIDYEASSSLILCIHGFYAGFENTTSSVADTSMTLP